jgi:hypothetical protein
MSEVPRVLRFRVIAVAVVKADENDTPFACGALRGDYWNRDIDIGTSQAVFNLMKKSGAPA